MLSRFLYMNDEVVWSFIDSLVKQRSLDETLFWIFEYYFSGYRKKTWQLLWATYYDFYAIKYPKLEKIILRKFTDNNETAILYIVKNLFYLTPDPTVFILRYKPLTSPSYIYSGEKPDWITHHPDFFIALHKKHLANAIYHMDSIPIEQLYQDICDYYTNIHNLPLNIKSLDLIPYKNKKHILIALLVHLSIDEDNIVKKAMLIAPDDSDLDILHTYKDSTAINPIRKTLPIKRVYPISPHIGCFKLDRYDDDWPSVSHILWYYWEYFSYFTPIWRKRFKQFQAVPGNDFTMIFPDDDAYEAFHELYYYEPDEQSKEIQEKSIGSIPMITLEEWIEEAF